MKFDKHAHFSEQQLPIIAMSNNNVALHKF